jgi:SAM-dependent methyltransferase
VSIAYRIMYRLGFTPWERGGVDPELAELLDQVDCARTSPYGKALDLGCGSGRQTLELARRAWDAVGIDNVPHAIDRARRRQSTGSVRFTVGDVTRLIDADIDDGYSLFVDRGCFHGLDDRHRRSVANDVTRLATDDADLLLFAFLRHRRPPPVAARR